MKKITQENIDAFINELLKSSHPSGTVQDISAGLKKFYETLPTIELPAKEVQEESKNGTI